MAVFHVEKKREHMTESNLHLNNLSNQTEKLTVINHVPNNLNNFLLSHSLYQHDLGEERHNKVSLQLEEEDRDKRLIRKEPMRSQFEHIFTN